MNACSFVSECQSKMWKGLFIGLHTPQPYSPADKEQLPLERCNRLNMQPLSKNRMHVTFVGGYETNKEIVAFCSPLHSFAAFTVAWKPFSRVGPLGPTWKPTGNNSPDGRSDRGDEKHGEKKKFSQRDVACRNKREKAIGHYHEWDAMFTGMQLYVLHCIVSFLWILLFWNYTTISQHFWNKKYLDLKQKILWTNNSIVCIRW